MGLHLQLTGTTISHTGASNGLPLGKTRPNAGARSARRSVRSSSQFRLLYGSTLTSESFWVSGIYCGVHLTAPDRVGGVDTGGWEDGGPFLSPSDTARTPRRARRVTAPQQPGASHPAREQARSHPERQAWTCMRPEASWLFLGGGQALVIHRNFSSSICCKSILSTSCKENAHPALQASSTSAGAAPASTSSAPRDAAQWSGE